MLRERYPKNTIFEDIVQHLAKMDPIHAKIDTNWNTRSCLHL